MVTDEEIKQWMEEHPFSKEGGFIMVYNGKIVGWSLNPLKTPNDWAPGCIAINVDDGFEFVASGGNYQDGATHWMGYHNSKYDEATGITVINTPRHEIDNRGSVNDGR